MKIASTTYDFISLPTEDHIEKVRHLANAGFKYIDLSLYEINKDNSPFVVAGWKNYVNELKSLEEELGIKYVQAHLPNFNPLDENTFGDYCKLTIRAIEVCGLLGIENAVIHIGWKPDITKEQFFLMNLIALRPLFPIMEKYNVNVLVENSTRANFGQMYYLYSGSDMKEFIEYVNHPLIHGCWDVGHANVEGPQYEDIIALGDDLRAIHVHDNNGHADQHIGLFMGTLNMDEIINALIDVGYKGYFTFEADSLISCGKTWLLNRRNFDKDTRLFNPTIEMYDAAEHLLYEIGKACLNAYGIFEE